LSKITHQEAAARLTVIERAIVDLAVLVETLRQDLAEPVEGLDMRNDLC